MKPHRLPLFFIISVILLLLFGLATFYVASLAERYTLGHFGSFFSYFEKTLLLLAISLGAAVTLQFVPYRAFRYLIAPACIAQVALLVIVLFVGRGAYGSRRWIPLVGSFGLQPSELHKLIVIIAVASVLTLAKRNFGLGSRALLVGAIAVPSALLIAKEPDLGTSILVLGVSVVMLVHFRLTGRQLVVLAVIIAVAACGIWAGLRPYQRERLETFLNPQRDPLGSGYNVIQSIVATGSGGLWGRGIRGSTQAPLSFVPVQYADFVFSLVGELFGFVGTTALIMLFVLLIWSSFLVCRSLSDDFGRYIVIGITTLWFLQALINIGMTIGLSPVTGIPLPFISYGGSSLLTHVCASSIVINVYRTRDELRF